jgi:hypothetical protein
MIGETNSTSLYRILYNMTSSFNLYINFGTQRFVKFQRMMKFSLQVILKLREVDERNTIYCLRPAQSE